jgi:hypothetical protein
VRVLKLVKWELLFQKLRLDWEIKLIVRDGHVAIVKDLYNRQVFNGIYIPCIVKPYIIDLHFSKLPPILIDYQKQV